MERREHQDNPDVYHQALPEPMPKEQDVHADHDGCQRECEKHDARLPSRRSTLPLEDRLAATDDAAGRQPVGRFPHNVPAFGWLVVIGARAEASAHRSVG